MVMNSSVSRVPAPVYGLVLSGGASTRMGQDKALLAHAGTPQLSATFHLLSRHVQACFVSLRPTQQQEPLRAQFPGLVDEVEGIGPAAGLISAHRAYPDVAWLVVACDLPMLRDSTLVSLMQARDPRHGAVAYRSAHDAQPEPMCALWEPVALAQLTEQVRSGRYRLRDALTMANVLVLPTPANGVLDNINTPQERERMMRDSERARGQ